MVRVTLIKGDGIGPATIDAAVKLIEASAVGVEWEEHFAGLSAFEKFKNPLPDETLASIKRTRLVFKGPLTTQIGKGFRSINVAIRQEFDLYANIRPAKSWKGARSRYENFDLVVIRENTEGLYASLEHYIGLKKNTTESIAVVTRGAADRITHAVKKVIDEGQYVTSDLNVDSPTGTNEMADAIIGAMT